MHSGAAAKSSKGGGGIMGMFGMGGGSSLEEEDVRIDMRDRDFNIKNRKKKQENQDKAVEDESKESLKIVSWINNIERDKKYSNYYKDLKPLKSFMVMQQVVPIRKNMYNGIAIFDPIDYSGYSIFNAIQDGVNQGVPMHLGFILYPKYLYKSQDTIVTDEDKQKRFISERITQCVVYLLQNSKGGAKQAGIFLSNLYSEILEKLQLQQQSAMEKMLASMTADPLDLNAAEVMIGDGDENVDTLPTENRIEEVISDFIVTDDDTKTKQETLMKIYKLDVSEYLEITKSFLEDKGITSLLQNVDPVEEDMIVGDDEDGDDSDDTDDKSEGSEETDEETAGCLLALNGRIFPHIMGEFSVYTMINVLMEEQRSYLMSYATGKISRRTNFNNYVYEKPDVLLRFSKFLSWLGTAGVASAIQTNSEVTDKVSNKSITLLNPKQLEDVDGNIAEDLYWGSIYTKNTDLNENSNVHTITVWLVVNPESITGRVVLSAFSKINTYFEEYGAKKAEASEAEDAEEKPEKPFGVRFAVLYNSENNKIPKTCVDLTKTECQLENGGFFWSKFKHSATSCAETEIDNLSLQDGDAENVKIQKYLTESLGLENNKNYIILNGEVIPLNNLLKEEDVTSIKNLIDPITSHDIWTLITRYNEEIEPIMATLFNEIDGIYVKQVSNSLNNMIIRVSNIMYHRRLHEGYKASRSLFTIANIDENLRNAVDSLSLSLLQNDEDGAPFSIQCVLDPLSPQTQRIISFIDELYAYHNLFDIDILLNPVSEMKDSINKYGFPKKLARYYRYVFNPNNYVTNVDNSDTISDKAVFINMPSDDVLTMGITDTPGTWLYESLVCKYDLDNLLLSKVNDPTNKGVLSVNYHLTRMLIQGQCFDEKSKPVPGLQLELRNATNVFDATIAMQTLGYWQLKANPGVWGMRLRDGRTTEVMGIDKNKTKSADAIIVNDVDQQPLIKVALNSFRSSPFRLRVKHKSGMENEELLPQLTEEQIEAQEQRRLKEKQEREAKKAKESGTESDDDSTDSKGSLLDKIKAKIFGKKEDSKKIEVKVKKNGEDKGKDEDEEDDTNDALASLLGISKPEKYVAPTPQRRVDAKPDEETTIHVMSVASGHLYERFLKVKFSITVTL